MGGEYFCSAAPYCFRRELPPRARRIRALNHSNFLCHGTTSACAENTAVCGGGDGRLGNYLRVRGEYTPPAAWGEGRVELPPRARRIPGLYAPGFSLPGTTSACAENTLRTTVRPVWWRNYLRVRGEYFMERKASTKGWELPPRARRIPLPTSTTASNPGTTSACAENTAASPGAPLSCRNYLRVRGEYMM